MAKPKIENVYIHTGGHGGQPSVHWTIGDRRFHVWLHGPRDEPDDVVHSNPIVSNNPRRDEHRGLDRTCKAQSVIWNEVWNIVTSGELIAKQRQADRAARDLHLRQSALKTAIAEIDREAIKEWEAGRFNESFHACAMLSRRRYLDLQLSRLSASGDTAAVSSDQIEFA